jgi:hypothetical protein
MLLSPLGPGTQLDDGCCFKLHTSQSYTRNSALWSGGERRRGGVAPLSADADDGGEEAGEEEEEEFTTPTQDSKVRSRWLWLVPKGSVAGVAALQRSVLYGRIQWCMINLSYCGNINKLSLSKLL